MVKDKVMYEVVLAKFSQHPELKAVLLATGNAFLFEKSPIDPYWGTGADGYGKNKLGTTLQRVRETLQEEVEEITPYDGSGSVEPLHTLNTSLALIAARPKG